MLRRNEDILCNSRRGDFGLSAPNWALLKAFQTEAKNVTLKHLSSTRWESRHNSIFALIQQYSNIITTLCHLKLTSTDSSMRSNADQLSEKITTMENFLFSCLYGRRYSEQFMLFLSNFSLSRQIWQHQQHCWAKLSIS